MTLPAGVARSTAQDTRTVEENPYDSETHLTLVRDFLLAEPLVSSSSSDFLRFAESSGDGAVVGLTMTRRFEEVDKKKNWKRDISRIAV